MEYVMVSVVGFRAPAILRGTTVQYSDGSVGWINPTRVSIETYRISKEQYDKEVLLRTR